MKFSQLKFNTLWVSLIVLAACSPKEKEKEENTELDRGNNAIIGLATPYKLEPGKNVMYLSDYFHQPEKVDSFAFEERISATRAGDSVLINAPLAEGDALSEASFWSGGNVYSIPLFLSNKKEVTVAFDDAEKQYQEVKLKGEMNAWNPNAAPLTYENGKWSCQLLVEPGTYQYKLVADGEEIEDPSNPNNMPNGLGGFNSVLTVEGEGGDVPNVAALAYTESTISFKTVPYVNVQAYWQNQRIGIEGDKSGVFQVTIPESAKELVRSHIRVYASNSAGIGNDVMIPLHQGKVISKVSQLHRTDYHNLVLYNAFVDRFNNADTTNDMPTPNDSILPQANYHGGDVLGVVEKVHDGYFESIGVNGVWLSPIVKNTKGAFGYWPEPETKFSAYHGYWPTSFTQIDKRMGTSTNLEELVDMAHNKDINVFIDFIANHVHKEHPVYQEHKDWATNLYLKNGELNTERWDDHRLSTWFDTHMPSLKLYEPEVYNMLSDSALYWIKKYGVDGFRHDATKHVPHHFWRALTQKVKTEVIEAENRNIYQIGETYGSRGLVGSYVNTGELNAQFDFNVYDDATAVFAGDEDVSRLAQGLEKSLKAYGSHHLMGNVTGNQDRCRFVSYADGSVSFAEDAKAAGWTREITIKDSTSLDKMALLMAFNFSVPGVPVIYYGDEIGMCGANDPDNRRMMRFENLTKKEKELKAKVGQLAEIRHNNLAMIYGQTKVLIADEGILVIERKYFDETAIVVINNNDQVQKVTIDGLEHLKANFNGTLEGNSLSVGANQFEILTNR
ncbi:MAG: alpha-amylase family glycosyl hydrolase [Bacteroidia bacterium]